MTALLVVVGLFSGSVTALPRAGSWMVWVKKLSGVVLLGMAEYYFIQMGQVCDEIRMVLTLALALPPALEAQDIGLAVGTQAPAVTVEDLDGKPVDLVAISASTP